TEATGNGRQVRELCSLRTADARPGKIDNRRWTNYQLLDGSVRTPLVRRNRQAYIIDIGVGIGVRWILHRVLQILIVEIPQPTRDHTTEGIVGNGRQICELYRLFLACV